MGAGGKYYFAPEFMATRIHWVILAGHAVTPMTAGLPSATDAPLQRGELAKSANSDLLISP